MSNDIVERETIQEARLFKEPEFYRSPTGNPLTDIIKGGKKAYNRLIILRGYYDVELTIPAPPFMGGIGTASVTVNHGVKKGVPLATVYTSIIAGSARVSVRAFKEVFVVRGVNYDPFERTVKVRVFIDEIKLKTRN